MNQRQKIETAMRGENLLQAELAEKDFSKGVKVCIILVALITLYVCFWTIIFNSIIIPGTPVEEFESPVLAGTIGCVIPILFYMLLPIKMPKSHDSPFYGLVTTIWVLLCSTLCLTYFSYYFVVNFDTEPYLTYVSLGHDKVRHAILIIAWIGEAVALFLMGLYLGRYEKGGTKGYGFMAMASGLLQLVVGLSYMFMASEGDYRTVETLEGIMWAVSVAPCTYITLLKFYQWFKPAPKAAVTYEEPIMAQVVQPGPPTPPRNFAPTPPPPPVKK